jgi:BirA family biotin operon repressor/biotin-[acetyl-CoA-carboxylase] ligase
VREAWRRVSLTLGARVTLPGGLEGMATDLDEDGALLVRADDGRLLRLASGEVGGAPAP